MSAVEALRRTFASARLSRNFRLFLSGQFVSAIGTWINFTASGWLVWRLTHSGSALGVNSALAFGPMLILGAWGGVLADRFNKRKILISTQSAFAVLALVMATLIATDVIELWMVYTLSVFTGLVIAIDNPARQSFYVEMVGEAELTNAVSSEQRGVHGRAGDRPGDRRHRDRDCRHGLVLRPRCRVVSVRAGRVGRDAAAASCTRNRVRRAIVGTSSPACATSGGRMSCVARSSCWRSCSRSCSSGRS